MNDRYYDLLKVSRNATAADIKKSFRKLALEHHPDKGGCSETFQNINIAHTILSDDVKRAEYDKKIQLSRSTDGMNFTDSRRGSESLNNSFMSAFLNRRGSNASQDTSSTSVPSSVNVPQPPPSKPSEAVPRPFSSSNATRPVSPVRGIRYVKQPLKIKLITIGDEGVGKSCIIKRFCEGRFVQRYIPTIGLDYGVKNVSLQAEGGHQVSSKVNFFDLSGCESSRYSRCDFFEHSQGVLLIYDVTNRSSFESLDNWIKESQSNGLSISQKGHPPAGPGLIAHKPPYVMLVANKVDATGRIVTRAEGQMFASNHGFEYIEMSAQSGMAVSEGIHTLIKKIITYVGAVRQGCVLSGMGADASTSMGGTKVCVFAN
eukprot:GDKJ01021284.1.p1 GENE.GDKJ01021284.1~~GDKJ01021284.1.p1  ORF type:complete len:373 (+),score=61.28 GDKJ01021284.1:16-1134(+)